MTRGPSEQPKKPPAGRPELPGEFVSEDLRADCARFLEELRALVGHRAGLLAAQPGWVAQRDAGASDRDAGTNP